MSRGISPNRLHKRIPIEYVSPHHVRAVDSMMRIRHLENSIEGIFIEETYQRVPLSPSTPNGYVSQYVRSPGGINRISQSIDSPVYDFQSQDHSPVRSPYGSPKMQTPGSPVGGSVDGNIIPRKFEAMVGEWKARASELNSNIQRHKHEIVKSRPLPGRIGSSSVEAVDAPPSVAVSVPPSVHTDDIEGMVGMDHLQKQIISLIDSNRPENPIRFDYLCSHTATVAATALNSGGSTPTVEGLVTFVHKGSVESLSSQLPPQLLQSSVTHVGAAHYNQGIIICYTHTGIPSNENNVDPDK